MTKRLGILLVCVAALLVGPATTQADTATKLPLTFAAGIIVDPAGQHVFVSGDSSVVVLNYSGKIIKTIQDEAGAAGMALDTTTHTLYVALNDASAISEIDTQTLAETHRFSTAPYTEPSSLVIAGGKLWFSCFESGCLVTANLDGTGLAAASGISGFSSSPAWLTAGGSDNHLLALVDRGGLPPSVAVYDVSGDTPTLVSSVSQLNGGSGGVMNQMTFDPSGAHLLAAESSPGWIQSLATSTLQPDAEYPTGPYPLAVAVTDDGKFVAGGISDNPSGKPDVFVYPIGSTTPVRTWDIGTSDTGNPLVGRSLAFSPDSSRLFAVTHGPDGHLEFNVLLSPTIKLTATHIKLSRSAPTVLYGHRVKFRVRVSGTRSGTVDLVATTSSHIPTRVASGKLKSGRVTLTVRPKESATYSAQLEQGPSYASSASKGSTVAVTVTLTVTTRAAGSAVVQGQPNSKTIVLVHVKPRPGTSVVGLVTQRRLNGRWTTTATASLPIRSRTVKGVLYSTYHGPARVQALWSGGSSYRGTKSAWHYFSTP